MSTLLRDFNVLFPNQRISLFYLPLLALMVNLSWIETSFGQTPGLIYKPAGSVLGKTVLDPNGDGYVSALSSGFGTLVDDGASSELNMAVLPVLIAEPVNDLTTGAPGKHTDIVSNAGGNSCYVLYKEVSGMPYLIVRFRVGYSSSAPKGYSLLIDTDGSYGIVKAAGNYGFEKEVVLEKEKKVVIYTHTASGTTLSKSYVVDDYSQRSIAASTVSGTTDYFYDFFVPYADLKIGSTSVRLAAVTITSAQSGIDGTKSDYNGIDDALYGNDPVAISKALISTFPATNLITITSGTTFAPVKTSPPVVDGNITTANTTISGTSTEADGTNIQVYKGGIALGSPVQVSNNAWILATGVSGNLTAGNLITAKATLTGKCQSDVSNSVEVATGDNQCYTPVPTNLSKTNGSQVVTGNWAPKNGTITASTIQIKLYQQNGVNNYSLIPSAAAVYVGTNGVWSFTTNMNQSTFNGVVVLAKATNTLTGGCEGDFSKPDFKSGTITATPSIYTTTITASPFDPEVVEVTNTTGTAAYLMLYVNGHEVARTTSTIASGARSTLTGAGTTLSYTGFLEGDIVTARAQSASANYWLSDISVSKTVTASALAVATTPPVITGSYIAGSGKTVTGTSTELAGTVIDLYEGAIKLNTTTVTAFGTWSISSLSLSGGAGKNLTAYATATGKTLSAVSNSVTVAASAPAAPTVTNLPYYAGATSISGTGGLGTVTVYVDGSSIGSVDFTGAWTLSDIPSNQLSKGAVITATNTVSSVVSQFSSPGVTVLGVGSFKITDTSDNSIGEQTAGNPFNIKVSAMSGTGGTGSIVSTFVTKAVLSSSNSSFGTGGGVTANFSSGVLSPKSISLTTEGDARTINAISPDDPSISGTTTVKVVPNVAAKLELDSPADIPAGTRAAYTVTRKDAYGNLVKAGSLTVNLTSDGTGGEFYNAASGGSTITSVVISDGSSSADTYFTSTTAGQYVVTASATGLTSAADGINVTKLTASKYIVTTSTATANASETVTITAQLADTWGNPVFTDNKTVTWSSTNGSFPSGTSSSTNSSGIATISYQVAAVAGTEHRVTASSDGGTITGLSNTITVLNGVPALQATNVVFSSQNAKTITVGWTNGDGSNRVVFMKQAGSGTTAPINGTSYVANPKFKSGTQIDKSGWYCIYNGAGSSVDVTGLTAGTTYIVQVFEYNNGAGSQNYLTAQGTGNPSTGSTLNRQLALNAPANILTTTRAHYTVTTKDNGGTNDATNGDALIVYLYASGTSGSFYTDGTSNTNIYFVTIPAGSSSVDFWFNATIKGDYTITVSDKYPADGDAGMKDASDPISVGTSSGAKYKVTSSSYSAYLSTQVTITAQLEDDKNNIVAESGKVVTWSSTSSGSFSSSTSTTNNSGIATVSFTVSPTAGTKHEVTATTSGITGISKQIKVVDTPPLSKQASNILFSTTSGTQSNITWTVGDGTARVVFIKRASSGTTIPVNNTTYVAKPNFGDGSQIPTGWYCVYNGTSNSVTVTGLDQVTDYQVQVFEYKGGAGFEQYNVSTASDNPKKLTTLSNNADLANLVVSQGILSPGFDPGTTSYTDYVASSVASLTVTPTFSESNATIKVNTVTVASGAASGALPLVTGVNTIQTVVTAHGGATKTYTITVIKAVEFAPSTQAYNILFSSVSTSSMSLSWTIGSGTERVVFIKQAVSGVAVPVSATTYYAYPVYLQGDQIGSTGWYCVYNGTGTSVSVSGLSPGTDYIAQVFEYTGAEGAEKYNTSTATNNPLSQKTNNLENTWSGTTDKDWHKSANWTLSHVPTAVDNVTIGNIGNGIVYRYPEISAAAVCNNITIASSASVTILTTGTFDVGGDITNNNGVNGLVIKSTASGTGSMIVQGTTIGSGTVERYTSDDRWYLVSPPAIQSVSSFLSGNLAIPYWQDLKDDPATLTDQYALAQYDTPNNHWELYFSDTNLGTGGAFSGWNLIVGDAYKAMTTQNSTNTNSTLYFKGTLNVGNEFVPVKADNSWNCVGNPYTSAIRLNDPTSSSENFLDANVDAPNTKSIDRNYAAIYYWDNTEKSYKIINKSDPMEYAQVGQGFFVKGRVNDTHIDFTPGMQTHQNANALKTAAVSYPQIILNAVFGTDKYATRIRFIDGMTDGLDIGYDAGLFRPSTGFALYTKLVEDNGVDFQLQCLPTNQYKNLVIPVGVESKSGGEVVFSALGTNLEAGCKMILEDKLTNIYTDLSINDYKAAVAANTVTSERFFLHTSDIVSAIAGQKLSTGRFTAYAVRNDEIRVIGEVTDKAVATLYNGLGKVVLMQKLGAGNLNIIGLPNLSSGVYLLNINDKGTAQTIKILIR